MYSLIALAERGFLPDSIIRLGIRRLLRLRIAEIDTTVATVAEADLAERLRDAPLAVATGEANAQHYEVTAEFFQRVLGPHMKYSCCYFENGDEALAQAEDDMLALTCQRAEIEDGMRLLELGCGWGSLTLRMARQYPHSQITALSNSASQREYILSQASVQGLTNLDVITADMRDFSTTNTFDRVVSVEMFEHMRNYALLFQRIASWLNPQGKAFAHVFCHRTTPYLFETEGAGNWMGRNFFTGGTMPSERLFHNFPHHLKIGKQWKVNGLHYWRTSEAWLNNLDSQRDVLLKCFSEGTSRAHAKRYLQRWRMFFMACAELFRFRGGNEWYVAHYLFEKSSTTAGHVHSQDLLTTSTTSSC